MRGPSADERSTRPSRASVGAHLTRGVYVDRLQGHLGRGGLGPENGPAVGGEGLLSAGHLFFARFVEGRGPDGGETGHRTRFGHSLAPIGTFILRHLPRASP